MTIICDYQTCAYCGEHLDNPVGRGIKIILSSICLWNGESVDRSGSFYICRHCYATKHWGRGELITGTYLKKENKNGEPKKLPKKVYKKFSKKNHGR